MWEILQTPELERALLIAIIAGPIMGLLGTFITLRGMAFFSDAISHAALTGVGLGVALRLANGYASNMDRLRASKGSWFAKRICAALFSLWIC